MQQRIPLAAIAPGETVRVAEICVEGALRRRLFDLGTDSADAHFVPLCCACGLTDGLHGARRRPLR